MIRRKLMRHPRQSQAGVGLLEVLVAVLLVSVGFLGMAALHAKALSTNNSAMARSNATMAAYSILDAMRSDVIAAQDGEYNIGSPLSATACPSSGGTLANRQLRQWCLELGRTLGELATTTGAVDCDRTGLCTITIQFDDQRGGVGGGAAQTVTTVSRL